MIRLLIAVFLFASAVFAQVEIPHVHENGDVIDADEINANLDIVANAVPPRDCSTNQIIKWNGSAWVCATDPFAGLNCNVGDQLRMGSGGWECRAEPITASLIQNNWDYYSVANMIDFTFESLNNVETSTSCDGVGCDIKVIGVADHSSCVTQVTGGAVSGNNAVVTIDTGVNEIEIGEPSTWNEGQGVYINISCTP